MPNDFPDRQPPDGADDARFDRVLRGSLIVFALLGVVGAGLFLWFHQKTDSAQARVTPLHAPAATDAATAEIPVTRFTDITVESGIKFTHVNGAYGEKLLPETMGGGVAFLDFDNDGAQDLLFVNSTFWPGHVPPGATPPTHALYRNDGAGHFTDVTAGSGLDITSYGMGVAIGDYDNDGLPDIFLTGVGENHLFHNLGGGKFQDVTGAAGVAGKPGDWGTSAAWIDLDNDGRLDLFVCNYVQWSKEIDLGVDYRLAGIGRAYGPPVNFPGSFPRLFHNDGRGHFADISRAAGVQVTNPVQGLPMAKSLALAPVDLNSDGWIDLVVANDTVQNFVFSNRWNRTFKEIGARAGIAFDSYGQTRGAMGIDSARFRNDDSLGIAIGNYANEMNTLFVSQRDYTMFADEAIGEGLGPASRQLLKFGLFFFDYDLDGRLDVLTANGHVEDEINKVQQSQQYRQPAQLFWNRGSTRGHSFVNVPAAKCGPDLFQPIVGRGSAFADIDGDGDLDAVLTQIGGPPLLIRNDQKLGHHWVRFKLVGAKANRDAIGAWIKVRAGSLTMSRQVMPTRSYLSQSELPVTFGLGKLDRLDEVTITWPGGTIEQVTGARIDAVNVVRQAGR